MMSGTRTEDSEVKLSLFVDDMILRGKIAYGPSPRKLVKANNNVTKF